MNQTEEQEKYNQQKTEGNDILENKVENLIEKIHGMDKKLNTLTNLAGDIAAQAREWKRTYESGSSDSRGKKKSRTYVDRQNLPQSSSSRNHDKATEVSENTSTDTSVTRPYGISDEEEENDDDTISLPDASILRRQIQDLCQECEDKGYSEGADDPILESICQEFSVKEAVGSPLKNSKLEGIINNLFIEKLDEEKLKKLFKTYNKPEKCPNMIAPKCNEEIWKGHMLNTSRSSKDIVLQKTQMHTVKTDTFDKIMKFNLKSDRCKEIKPLPLML